MTFNDDCEITLFQQRLPNRLTYMKKDYSKDNKTHRTPTKVNFFISLLSYLKKTFLLSLFAFSFQLLKETGRPLGNLV